MQGHLASRLTENSVVHGHTICRHNMQGNTTELEITKASEKKESDRLDQTTHLLDMNVIKVEMMDICIARNVAFVLLLCCFLFKVLLYQNVSINPH